MIPGGIIPVLVQFAETYGYFAVVVFDFSISVVAFIGIPDILVNFASLILNPTLVAVSAASGITLAKLVILKVSRFGRKRVSEKTKTRLQPLIKLAEKYGWKAALIAAGTPVPDDIVYVTLGISNYPIRKIIPAIFVGKFASYFVVSWSVRLVFSSLWAAAYQSISLTTVLMWGFTATISILGIVAVFKLDWMKLMRRFFPTL
jgi:membrane protein YqaA with SNARE-associated domain